MGTRMDKYLEKLWRWVMHDQDVSVEIRLFRLITLTVFLLCAFVIIPTNLLQDLPPRLNQVTVLYNLAAIYLYFSSCRGRHYIKSFYVLTILVLNVAWFLNGGSVGSIGYYIFATILYPLIFFRGLTRPLMFLLLVLDACALLLVERIYPFLVIPFRNADDRLIDLMSGFSFNALASAIVFWVVVTSLEHELDERKRAQRSLVENQKSLRMLMDSMPSGIRWFAEEGNIEYLNRCFTEQFGYTLEDIPTLEEWFRHAYPDDSQRLSYVTAQKSAIGEARKNGALVPLREAKITCKDGSVKHAIINTQFVLGRTIEIFTDITERESIQDQILKVQRLESLGVLAGGIAHDFNNILTSIMGNISLAELLIDPGHEAQGRLRQAGKASQRAAELASQLLTFSKGSQPIKAPVNVAQLLEESLSFSLRGSNVQGATAVSSELRTVEADEGQLSQVFNNIIINAVHAMPQGGTLTIGGENVALDDANLLNLPAGTYIRLTFADQGIGISEGDQKKIFDPYFTTKSTGTGLGLASSFSIVTKHGGHIAVQSSPGTGAVFTIHLPAMGNAPARMRPFESGPSAGIHGEGAVLIMDDEEMIRESAATMLTQFGYQVQTCANGDETISRYKAAREKDTPFAAVILDLTIPGGMGGKETAQQLLAMDRDARLIVSSGHSNALAIAEWDRHGFSGFLKKPYAAADLLQVLSGVINNGG